MSLVTLDLEFTRTNLDRDCKLVKTLIQIAVEDLSALETDLRSALQRNETEQLQRLSHAIKGLASNFRAEPLTSLSEKLEKASLASHQPLLRQLVDEVSIACKSTVLALSAELRLASNGD